MLRALAHIRLMKIRTAWDRPAGNLPPGVRQRTEVFKQLRIIAVPTCAGPPHLRATDGETTSVEFGSLGGVASGA